MGQESVFNGPKTYRQIKKRRQRAIKKKKLRAAGAKKAEKLIKKGAVVKPNKPVASTSVNIPLINEVLNQVISWAQAKVWVQFRNLTKKATK